MDRRRAAGALLALAACVACSTAAPTASNQTALELLESPTEGCYYNFQHYGEGDRIMTNEPCLNCTCHNRMLMCYLRVCPFTKPIGQDCTIEKRADQCCPIVTCPDVPVDLLTSTSTSSPAEYGGTGLGKVDKYGCSINGKYFPEGSKVPPTPNKPCEHCYCIRNMTTCVMQECTLHVDGCTPIYHKDVCCPVRYSCDHQEDETLLLDDMTTTVRPTPGFLLTTTTMAAVTQMSQDCVHDDQIFADGALIKTEKACEHCYCMKGDIVCVVQECGTPMENEGKNCTSLAPRQGQCCPDTYICEGDELISDVTTGTTFEDLTTLSPPRRVEGSGYRNEPDEPYTEIPTFEGSGEEQATTLYTSHEFTSHKHTPEIIDEVFEATEEPLKPSFSTIEPDKGQNTVPYDFEESTPPSHLGAKTTLSKEEFVETQSSTVGSVKDSDISEVKTTASDYYSTERGSAVFTDKELMMTTETAQRTDSEPTKAAIGESEVEKETATSFVGIEEVTTVHEYLEPSSSESSTLQDQENDLQTADISKVDETDVTKITTTEVPKEVYENENNNRPEQDPLVISDMDKIENIAPSTTSKTELFETTSINPVENEIDEDILPPGRIPGEGDCLLNGITYKNNTSVPNINNCHSSCKCFSSIVKCDPIICSPPPDVMDNMNDCQPIYDTTDACCPTYVCHSRETIPPESHSQMSGTESPRPSSEKPVSDCKGEQCPALEKSPELCNSEECQVQEQVKECENGLCVEQTELESDKSPPQKYPEECVGDNCFLPPSDDKCIDGKCQQPIVTDDICNNENGCQTPEVALCDGPNCKPDMNIPKDEKPEISQPSCEGSSECDSTVTKHTAPSECSDESCRRKEQSQHESPQKCSGSNCNIPEEDTHDLTNDTTDIPSIDVSYKESTTEKIEESFSKSPQPEVTLIDQEAEKVTQDEVVATEKQETLELTTEKSIDVTDKVEDHVTENQEFPTEPSELHVTKSDSTVTETYREPDTGDDSFIPEAYSTQSEEQVTQSIEHITKEISTEMPLMYEEHSTVISTEVESSTQERFTESVKTPATSTEILQTTLNHIDENKESETNTEINEEITQEYEIHTETPNIHPPDIPKTDTKQETDTESLLITTTHLDETNLDKDIITERQPEIGITESSLPVSHDTYTEQHVGYTGKEGDVMTTESYIMTTDNLIPIDQTSETQETKINAPVTNKVYDDTQTKEVITENPNLYTEKAPFEPQSQDHFITDKDFSQKTTQGTPSENVDMESTVSPIKDQQEYAGLPDIQPVPDKQDASEETQEYMTSTITPDTYVTLPSITGEKQETQKPEIPATEQVAINPTEHFDEPTETSISQDFAMKESSTNHPEISDTTLQGITNADEIKTSTDHDTVEQGTKAPEENFQDDTTQKESVVTKDIAEETEEDDIKFKPISEDAALETTISSIISDKDQEISTKYEDEEATGYIDGSTLVPEKAPTFDKSTLPPNRRVESETAPTESSEKHTLGTNVSDETPTTFKPTEDENVDKESTETIVTYSDKHVFDITSAAPESSEEKEGITASTIDQKAEEMPFTVPEISETHEQSFEKTDTVPSKEVVTEQIGSDVKGDTDKQIFTSTEYPDVHETTVENIYTHTSETQSHDEDTKLVPELHTEIPTTSVHLEKDEKNTETPMSLVTESEVHEMTPIKSEDSSIKITLEKTTQMSVIDESSEVTMQSPGYHEMESPKHSTESSDIPVSEKEDVYDTPSPIHHEKENKLESPSTIAAVEYTTLKNTDIQKESFTTSPIIEDVVVDIVTETVEQQAPTTKYPEVLHEFSTMNPLIDNSEKSSTIQQQEGSPRPLEINTAVTDITFEQESNVQSTDQTINSDQETSTQSKITETVLEDQTSVYDKNVQEIQEQHEHTTLPEFLTTKYVETSDSVNEKESTENKSDKEGMSTFAYEENVTIHNLPNTEPSVSNAVLLDHEKSTTLTQMLDAEDLTTPSYDDSNTIKGDDISNAHISTTGIITTESSIDEEDHRRTLSTAVETEAEVLTTVKEEIPFKGYTTELPEINKTDLLEDSDKIDITSTDTPVKEIITLAPADEHQKPEYATSIPQSEDEVLLQTDGNVSYGDQDLTVATESINKHITEVQYTTDKPLLTEQDLQTELPTKDKDEVTDRTTVQVDLVNIPDEKVSEEIPPQHIVPHDSGTESLPTVTETESSSILETGTLEPHKTYTESSDLSETEKSVFEEMATSISDETVTSVPKETETSLPIETEVTVPKEIDTSISIETETTVPTETETSISLDITTKYSSPVEAVTETLVHKETEPSVAIEMGTETSVSTETQTSIPLKTDISVPVQTETEMSVLKETYDLSSEPTEPTVPKVTDASQKETETTQEYTEPESSIDQIKDEKLPEGVPPTIEPTYSSSETTPYLVELQEHTNKLNEDISSVIPPDTLTTKASEIYQTERGDQPVEYVDQSTQKEIHEVQTESTLAETVEKQTTSPQKQPTDFQTSTSVHEEIPHKTQEVTEEIPPALVDTPPEDNIPTVLTEEQSSTTIPTVSFTSEHEKQTTFESTSSEKTPEQQDIQETIAPEDELLPTITKATTSRTMDTTTQVPTVQDKVTKPEEKPEPYPSTTGPEVHKPGVNEIQPTEEIPSPDFPPSGTSGYGQEPDYVEEDQAFGPGTCRYGGKVYVSAQQIPRDDPCDFCFCFRSDIICLQQSCPPPIQGCHEEPIQGFCCPRYECPVSMATTLNVTTTTTTTTTTLPPHFLPHAYKGAAQRRGCQIKGHTYKVGDVVRASSGPCLHCTCGGDGQMKCDPKACTPEPMLRQMIAAAVSAKRRR